MSLVTLSRVDSVTGLVLELYQQQQTDTLGDVITMTKPTKANAKAWLAQQDGKTFVTSQVRHSGELWQPGPRVLKVRDRNPNLPRFFFAPKGAPSYIIGSETVIDGREYKVLELDENHMTLAWLNDRGDFISVTEYRLEGQP